MQRRRGADSGSAAEPQLERFEFVLEERDLLLHGATWFWQPIERDQLRRKLRRCLRDMRCDRGTRLVVGKAACEFVAVDRFEGTVGVGDQARGGKHFAGESLERPRKHGRRNCAQAVHAPANVHEVARRAATIALRSHRRLRAQRAELRCKTGRDDLVQTLRPLKTREPIFAEIAQYYLVTDQRAR